MNLIKRIVSFLLCRSGSQSYKADILAAKTAYAQFEASDDKKSPEAHSRLVSSIELYSRVADSYRQSNHRDLYVILVSLANAIWNQYENFDLGEEKLSDDAQGQLQRAIDLYSEALQTLPKSEVAQQGTMYSNLAHAYRERFIRMHKTSDIKSAAGLYQKASQSHVKTSREAVELLMETGRAYSMWHYHTSMFSTHTCNEITMAIEALSEAYSRCEAIQDCADIQLTCAYTLAPIYHDLLKAHAKQEPTPSQPLDYLNQAINLYQFALENTTNPDNRLRDAHQALANLLFYRYDTRHNNRDLIEAQTVAKTCVHRYTTLTPDYRELLDIIIDFDPKASRRDSRERRSTLRMHTLSGNYGNYVGSVSNHDYSMSQATEEPDSIQPSPLTPSHSRTNAGSRSGGLLVPPLLYSRSTSSRKELGITYTYSNRAGNPQTHGVF